MIKNDLASLVNGKGPLGLLEPSGERTTEVRSCPSERGERTRGRERRKKQRERPPRGAIPMPPD